LGEAALNFEMPRILGSLWTASLRPYYSFRNVWIYQDAPNTDPTDLSRDRVSEFSEDRIGVRLSAGRQLERNGVILGEIRYESQRYREIDTVPEPEFQPLTTLRGIVRWDDRDRIDFGTRGRVIDLFFESSLLNFSNGLSFTKFYARASTIVPIGEFAITPGAYIGAADRTLPGPELFSLGGQDLFLGMREDEERGRQIAVANLEGRYHLPIDIIFPTYVSIRYDLGAVWAEPEQIKFAAFQHGIGATVGFDTPVGPARFSVGRRFRFLSNPDSVAWGDFLPYFAIGVRL
jgi:NTE family protein